LCCHYYPALATAANGSRNKKMMATDCKVRVRKLFCLPIREKLS
jgi:hypothetical protein